MNKIDLGDQLRNYYCMDRWKRQFKWWFALWMWGFEVSLVVNAYITYIKMCTNLYKMEKRNMWTHYEFQKWVALGWINPEKYGPNSHNFLEASRKKHSTFRGRTFTPDSSTPTSIPMDRNSTSTRIRCNRVNDTALDPLNGSLCQRLVFGGRYNLRHTPLPSTNESLCALHRWKYGRENKNSKVKRQVVKCKDCLVHLCVPCFNLFHTPMTIRQLKAKVGQSITTNHQTNKRKR